MRGFTHQRLRTVALQQDEFLREQFTIDVSLYSPDMFIFIDETGADKRNSLRKYGYGLRGKPATTKSLLVWGERVSAIACMSMNGILDVKAHKETSNGDIFYEFIHTHTSSHICVLSMDRILILWLSWITAQYTTAEKWCQPSLISELWCTFFLPILPTSTLLRKLSLRLKRIKRP